MEVWNRMMKLQFLSAANVRVRETMVPDLYQICSGSQVYHEFCERKWLGTSGAAMYAKKNGKMHRDPRRLILKWLISPGPQQLRPQKN